MNDMSWNWRASLAAWRAENPHDEEQLQILFGVGAETLERIEGAELDPEPELQERIIRVIFEDRASTDNPPAGARCGPSPRAEARRGAAILNGAVAPLLPPIGAVLAQADGEWVVRVLAANGDEQDMTIAEARRWIGAVAPLVALFDGQIFPKQGG